LVIIRVELNLGIDIKDRAADASANRVQVPINLGVVGEFKMPGIFTPFFWPLPIEGSVISAAMPASCSTQMAEETTRSQTMAREYLDKKLHLRLARRYWKKHVSSVPICRW
jgi:hypothetical protein